MKNDVESNDLIAEMLLAPVRQPSRFLLVMFHVSVGLGDGDWKAKLIDQRGIQIKVFWVMVPGPASPYRFLFLWSWELTHPNYHEA